ncbi:carboxylesterase/lipase family protein [Kushneria marisflavi]|uniref:Carboxylic ester hydrolase n=1 Tax=Kushneria marisflavi TaxID=157779 RepID=A0A240UQG9_9GAMM|nr:carboxylesterase family protein [Kushneria marisflavi]ART63376.1 carboxylesterase [Kushneria marisflavi]RKD84424.1 carboxylesterase type B [Kushneria marisflavi]
MQRWLKGLLTLGLLATPLWAWAQASSSHPTRVDIDTGTLRGSSMLDVTAFKGIPYAAPPTGENRWRPPQPARPWSGVREATRFGPDCMQHPAPGDAAPLGARSSENCLYLNVWAPADAIPDPRADSAMTNHPVLVWIHGGGYVNGGTSAPVYDGSAFARDGVILVSLNYRLGRFGFFAHPALSREQPGQALGNYAIMDQLAALNWVQRNIGAFGGDAANVTIMGESAGGASVLDLTGSPAARGLFQRAVVMSGGGRALMGPMPKLSDEQGEQPSAETIGENFAHRHGITGTGSDALAALRALPADQVVDGLNMQSLMAPRKGPRTWTGGPIRDGELVSGPPEGIYRAGLQQHVPIMIGTTDADLGFSTADSMEALFSPFGADADQARALYDPTGSDDVQRIGWRVGMDRMMTEPARFVANQVAATGEPVWRYRFSHVALEARDDWPGAVHASELPYLFRTLDARYDHLDDSGRAMAWQLHRYVVNFARDGNPNGGGAPTWPLHTPLSNLIMDFTQHQGPVARQDPWQTRLDLIERHFTPALDH